MYSPDLGILDRDQNGGIFVQIEMRVALALPNNSTHREKNKFTFGLAALVETNLYSFEYKFHATSDTNNNRFLIKDNTALAQNKSSLLTPTGPSAGWLVFRIEILLRTTAGGSGMVRVLVDEDGDTNVNLTQILSVVDDTHQIFRRFPLTHRTTDPTQYAMQFRNLQVGPLNP